MLERLPIEIYHCIIACVPPWDLPRLSLVCSDWRLLVFPQLYRTLFFDNYSITNEIVARINQEHKISGPHMTSCVYELLVDIDPREATNSDHEGDEQSSMGLHSLPDTDLAISKLKNLKSVYWGPNWLLARSQTLEEVRLHTELQSLHLHLELTELSPAGAERILAFKNLQKLHLTFSMDYSRYSRTFEHPNPEANFHDNVRHPRQLDIPRLLDQMLCACQDLEELSLCFETSFRSSVSPLIWSPNAILEVLVDQNFPRLRVLRLRQPYQSDNCLEIQRFLLKHPKIHTLNLHTCTRAALWLEGQKIEELIPNIRYFKGSARLTQSLTGSGLAEQLEGLTVAEHIRRGLRFPSMKEFKPLSLPRLREINTTRHVQVQGLVDATSNLERMRITANFDIHFSGTANSRNLVKILQSAPKLRLLQLEVGYPGFIKHKPNTDVATQFLNFVILLCPHIRQIEYHSLGDGLLGYWDVFHDCNGNRSFHYYFNPSFTLFSDIGFPTTRITSRFRFPPSRQYNNWYNGVSYRWSLRRY